MVGSNADERGRDSSRSDHHRSVVQLNCWSGIRDTSHAIVDIGFRVGSLPVLGCLRVQSNPYHHHHGRVQFRAIGWSGFH